jgi:uncharacterized membrane protein
MISYKRHIIKSISWRIIGSLDTLLLTFIITGNIFYGLSISAVELITKLILYFLHERLWIKYKLLNSNKRHIFKTITWRIIGTIDTFLLAVIITGDTSVSVQIGVIEVFTKMILYYGHEKLWYQIDFGLEKRNKKKLDNNQSNNL